MVESFDRHWPGNCGLVVVLDDQVLAPEVLPIIQKRGGAVATLEGDEAFQAF